MSVPVPVDRLRAAIDERGAAGYLLTVSDEGAPHAVHVPIAWEGDAIVADVGKRTAANAAARPAVALLFPARAADGYTLIVDGAATVAGGRVRVAPAQAVLHRAAARPDPSAACAADCVPLLPRSSTPR